MFNYKLTIQYNGAAFAGWQIQNDVETVQSNITRALGTLLKEEVNLLGSGRTDTGVHALGQAANFRTEKELDSYRFLNSLNALVSDDISITEMSRVSEDFHARFDAKKRCYIYLLNTKPSPFYRNYSWFYPNFFERFDVTRLNEFSEILLGEHDFSALSKKNDDINNKKCTIYNIRWRKQGSFILFYIEGNRFLHGMVRIITGSLLQAYNEETPAEWLRQLIQSENRENAGTAVPAKGLFLYKVRY